MLLPKFKPFSILNSANRVTLLMPLCLDEDHAQAKRTCQPFTALYSSQSHCSCQRFQAVSCVSLAVWDKVLVYSCMLYLRKFKSALRSATRTSGLWPWIFLVCVMLTNSRIACRAGPPKARLQYEAWTETKSHESQTILSSSLEYMFKYCLLRSLKHFFSLKYS